ncbi:substrate-binding periplasmic protein [Litoribrevibacter albus]|uniref:Transporter substrate-binding domain-containing protein n=1 Tax=Litoribrevibacter albus TaxID=1473156 RepID=A0AA37SD08_9GAMM|nr:transporter substrate-binding domain-containing protein [Litoribrevibacter albus]GLQ32147.1 hypothetical protein GCM10007876_26260 [Litoribrevibacter albus]
MKRRRILTVLSLLICMNAVHAIEPSPTTLEIKLATALIEPYQSYDEAGNLIGSGMNAIRCIEHESGLRFSIDVLPWKRAQDLVSTGEYDGFFVGSQNEKRDQFATYIGPLLHSFWHWYVPQDVEMNLNEDGTPAEHDQTIGVVLGTNMHQWISQKPGYKVITNTHSTPLFELLKAGRLDYVLATGAMYNEYLNSTQESEDTQFNVLVAKSKPLGLYLGHQFIARQSNIVKLIEKSAARCAP